MTLLLFYITIDIIEIIDIIYTVDTIDITIDISDTIDTIDIRDIIDTSDIPSDIKDIMGLLWSPYGTPIGFLNIVPRCWSIRPCVVIVAQSFFSFQYGFLSLSYGFPIDRPTTKDILCSWSVLSCVVIVARSLSFNRFL